MYTGIIAIRQKLQTAAESCGRDPEEIRLVAVSKKISLEKIQIVASQGQTLFGENYIQEAKTKIETMGTSDLEWHFIGHLQSNKAKYAVRYFDLIHSVDSLKLARAISREAAKNNRIQSILLQVNLAGEASKSGVVAKDAFNLALEIQSLSNISLKGLMTMPPFHADPEETRPFFKALYNLHAQIRKNLGSSKFTELSMGMSADFEVAIQEGATLVRVGTAIFGPR